MSTLTLPQARIPLGWALLPDPRSPGGQRRVAVEIDIEWMRAFLELVARTGGTTGSGGFEDYLPVLLDSIAPDPAAQEAIRAVDELRNELASARNEVQTLRALIDDQATELAAHRSTDDLRSQLEDLAAQLAELRPATDLRARVEQIEDRLQ